MAKAQTLPADCVILDLEDAVLPSHKLDARQALRAALESHEFGFSEVLVRINGVDTDWWQDDLAALAGTGVDGVVLPKVESRSDIASVASVMASISDGPQSLWIMLESPKGVLNAAELCAYGAPVVSVLIGTADLSEALKLPHTTWREGLQYSLSQCVLAARAAGISVVDGVFMDVDDPDGLLRECQQGREMGFDGKSLIHPAQLETSNQLFAPTPEQVQVATELIIAWKVSEREGKAVCLHRGQLVEQLHVRQAEQVLALASEVEKRDAG
ncbi:MAG: CoA ester lyase [Gammaproteobacteria bacterium]|nr:CoA ester lyase [Gammaproteobacteria bacterium]